MIGGTILLLDLRMLGLGLRGQRVADVARDSSPWFVGSLVVMLITGAGLFAVRGDEVLLLLTPFSVKMTCLALAILFAFTVRRKVASAEDGRVRPLYYKLVALVSLALWFGVGAGGRWIGFSG